MLRRLLHTFPEAPELAVRNIVCGTPSVDPRVPAKPKFQVLGLGSVLQVQLPSSIELFAGRNSIAGILGTGVSTSSLTSRLKISRSPLVSLWARQPVIQQQIVSSSPLTCLVSANNKYINAMDLDGTTDWVVKSPLLAFTGQQLNITPKWGFLPGQSPFAHVLVSGRGLLSWATPSSTIQVSVPQGESVIVQKRNLSAFTIDTNSTHRIPKLTKLEFDFKAPVVADAQSESANVQQSVWETIKLNTFHIFKVLREYTNWFTKVGTSRQYVEIYGPSIVLLSSSAKPLRKSPGLEQ